MAVLKDEVKRFVVQALACYDTPTQVSEAVKEEFGVDVPRSQVAMYDPTKHAGRNLSRKFQDLFHDTRERFRKEVSEIPIADQAYRLRTLNRMLGEAVKRKNIVLAAQLIEQAAKEAGGAFTNSKKHELAGPNGGPIPMMPTTIELVAPSSEHSQD